MRMLVLLLLGGCAAPAIVDAPTSDNGGCRWTEVACVDGATSKPNGTCCPEGFACGGSFPNVGCPAGSCCDERQAPEMGARKTVLQRKVTP